MKIALVSPPLDTGESEGNSLFRIVHDLAKAKIYWNKPLRTLLRRVNLLDFEDYPLGLLQLAAVLTPEHEIRIVNTLAGDDIATLYDFRPDIVGFNCSGGGNLVWIDRLSRRLKRDLGSLVFFGGSHVSLLPEQSLGSTVADYVFIGEADQTIKQTIDVIEGKQTEFPKTGLCYRKNGRIIVSPAAIVDDPDTLPPPAHQLVDGGRYKSVSIQVSRGCPNHCSFCYIAGYKPHPLWRTRSISSLTREIDLIRSLDRHKTRRIYFVDANFSGNKVLIKALLSKIIEGKLDLRFWTGADIDLDDEMLDLLKQAGCSFFFVGMESATPRRLKQLPKVHSRERMVSFIERTARAGLSPTINIILLLPGETFSEMKGTLQFCRQLADRFRRLSTDPGQTIYFYPNLYRPVPGTPDFARLIEQGWQAPNSLRHWGYLYNDISNGVLKRFNLSKNIDRPALIGILLGYASLNARTHVLPRFIPYLPGSMMVRKREC